jgi:uncharacterized protein YjlB
MNIVVVQMNDHEPGIIAPDLHISINNSATFRTMVHPEQLFIRDNGVFPGSEFPVLLYRKALRLPLLFPAKKVKQLFTKHNWTNNWRNGIYTYHHYHSNTHEAMGVIKGKTTLILGGENGKQVLLQKGDIIVIPAGVAHKNLGREKDVICVGGYPEGKDFDMNYGDPGERPGTDKNIRLVHLPSAGPLLGERDPLLNIWAVYGSANLRSASAKAT